MGARFSLLAVIVFNLVDLMPLICLLASRAIISKVHDSSPTDPVFKSHYVSCTAARHAALLLCRLLKRTVPAFLLASRMSLFKKPLAKEQCYNMLNGTSYLRALVWYQFPSINLKSKLQECFSGNLFRRNLCKILSLPFFSSEDPCLTSVPKRINQKQIPRVFLQECVSKKHL